jgi:hypothetical protein
MHSRIEGWKCHDTFGARHINPGFAMAHLYLAVCSPVVIAHQLLPQNSSSFIFAENRDICEIFGTVSASGILAFAVIAPLWQALKTIY